MHAIRKLIAYISEPEKERDKTAGSQYTRNLNDSYQSKKFKNLTKC